VFDTSSRGVSAVTAVTSITSVASRLATLEAELDALATVPDVELIFGSAFEAASTVLRIRRRVDALAARTSAAYSTSGDWSIDGARSAKTLLAGRWGVPRILDKLSLDERMRPWPEVEGISHRSSRLRRFSP